MPIVARRTPSVLSALGLSPRQERLYRRLRVASGSHLRIVVEFLETDEDALRLELAPLQERGLVTLHDSRLRVVTPSVALSSMLASEASAAGELRDRLEGLTAAVAHLSAENSRPSPDEISDVQPLAGEQSSGGDPLKLLSALIEQSRGDMLWLRPDTWQMARHHLFADVIAAAVATGRRSRAIYPFRALAEVPDLLRERARAGEELRLVADLPTRMIVIGNTHAVLPEPLGFTDQPRLLIRQGAVVESLTLLFELIWERASPITDLERGHARGDHRRLLLEQLAAGAKDEQIARAMGLSLRTVRRRVSELMDEFHVETRFQAGAEAVRRGLL